VICSRVRSNHSMISSTVAPASRFWKTMATGMRVLRKTQAPLTFPGFQPRGIVTNPALAWSGSFKSSYTRSTDAKRTRRRLQPCGKFGLSWPDELGKIVLPWKPKFQARGRWCCPAGFGKDWACGPAIRSTFGSRVTPSFCARDEQGGENQRRSSTLALGLPC
jgi:hypothetical protein